jgi:hypothetical protein
MKLRLPLLLILSLLFLPELKSQEPDLDSLLDVILFEDEELISLLNGKTNYQFLYFRTHFENQSYFSGRDIGIEQYNYSAQISYFHSRGFNLGAGTIWYSQFNPKLYASYLSLGFSGRFDKKGDFRYRTAYNRYFYSKVDSIESHAFNNAFSAGATLDKGFIGTRLDFALLTGDEFAGQVSWELYGDITLIKLGTFDRIKFEPEVSLFFGKEIAAYYQLGGMGQSQEYEWVEDTEFGLLNTAIRFPITIDYKNFDLEFGYNINLPNSMLTGEKLPMTTYFNLSLGYIIGLN